MSDPRSVYARWESLKASPDQFSTCLAVEVTGYLDRIQELETTLRTIRGMTVLSEAALASDTVHVMASIDDIARRALEANE